MRLADLVRWLDGYLRVRDIGDDAVALNGLQVENGGEVTRVAVAVDACQAVFDMAAAAKVDLLIVHHGLFWGGLEPITGRHHLRIATLLKHGIALYGAHIPLDVHPEVGNNAVLAGRLGMAVQGWWGEYRGAPIAVRGELDLPREALGARIAEVLRVQPKLLPGGPVRARQVGIVTGAGGSMIAEAKAAGLDTLITGEGKHHSYFDAEELGVNVFYAGHYATETVGVQALGARLAEQHGLPWSFLDHPTGL
jgi:dinuclear metal center YbgI/SA1388 family protein